MGQTEQQLKDALTTAENVAPCILWVDEIEKGLSGAGSSNDGGVSTRMVGQFLFWLQECRKQVFVVATANDVSMLPSELLRRGRFDELFFIDLPTSDERKEIIGLYTSKIIDALQQEFPDIELKEIMLGIVSKCYLGENYEVHNFDTIGEIAEHYRQGEAMPGGLEKARSIAKRGGYEFIEVYVDCCRAVSINGTVSVIV